MYSHSRKVEECSVVDFKPQQIVVHASLNGDVMRQVQSNGMAKIGINITASGNKDISVNLVHI